MRARIEIWGIMILTLAATVVYAFSNGGKLEIGGFKLRKIDFSGLLNNTTKGSLKPSESDNTLSNNVDTTRQRILFFGDSMTEGLFYSLDDYCNANGHTLFSITWYSATTESFANSNILDTYIRLYHPTYFIICLGSNELFVRDLPDRKRYIQAILRKLGNRPHVWISPPNWTKDTGMDAIIRQSVGDKRFFNSSTLTLQRSDDHIHPTIEASAQWMKHIADWLQSPGKTAHPIILRRPTKKTKHTFTDYYQTDFKKFEGSDNPERHRHFFR